MLIRHATSADLGLLAPIEAEGDAQFEEWFDGPTGWDPPTPGDARARTPGFLLVAETEGAVVGFAHVLEIEGCCHLEQLCVTPSYQRRGIGRELVERVKREAAQRGYAAVSLCTYADVPWNAPFYLTCGFLETEPTVPLHRQLRDKERELGLDRHGARILMVASLTSRGVTDE